MPDSTHVQSKPHVPWSRLTGEFFVIVLGVLVALGADAWYDSRADRDDEADYLARLHAAVSDDTANFRWIMGWMDEKEASLTRLDAVFSDASAPVSPERLLADLTAAANFGWNVGPLVGTATFEDLRSSGRLGLIADADLRTRIIRYYELADSEDRRMQARRTQYPHVSYQLVPFLRETDDSAELASSDDVPALLVRLRDSELPGLVLAESNRARFVRAALAGLLTEATDLLVSIDSALSDRSEADRP